MQPRRRGRRQGTHPIAQQEEPNEFSNLSQAIRNFTNRKKLLYRHRKFREYHDANFRNFDLHHTFSQPMTTFTKVPLMRCNLVGLKDLIRSVDQEMHGRFLLCRTICVPSKISALCTIIDDPDGLFSSRLFLYNYADVVGQVHSRDAYIHMPVGTILAIMNPLFKTNFDGGYGIRCDNPAQVVKLLPMKVKELLGDITWRKHIPAQYLLRNVSSDEDESQPVASTSQGHFSGSVAPVTRSTSALKIAAAAEATAAAETTATTETTTAYETTTTTEATAAAAAAVTTAATKKKKKKKKKPKKKRSCLEIGRHFHLIRRYHDAISAYTRGLADDTINLEMKMKLLSNRSDAYGKLYRYNLALEDAQAALDIVPDDIHAIMMKVKSLYGLTQYLEGMTFLNSVEVTSASEREATKYKDEFKALINKGDRHIAESTTGSYNFPKIFSNENEFRYHDMAEYQGPVVVKNAGSKGNGLFAKRSIQAGELILASKAFAYVAYTPDNEEETFINQRDLPHGQESIYLDRCQSQLVSDILYKIADDPLKRLELYKLYGGREYLDIPESRNFDVDVRRIESICHYNSFGGGGFPASDDEPVCGLWIYPSFLNHGCIDSNCMWFRNGNFMFVRAFRDIPKDEELTISYTPIEMYPQSRLDQYGFTCDCRLCARNLQDDAQTKEVRTKFQRFLEIMLKESLLESPPCKLVYGYTETEALMMIKKLEDTRQDAPDLNFGYVNEIRKMGKLYLMYKEYVKCVEILENLYETMLKDVASAALWTVDIVADIIVALILNRSANLTERWIRVLKQRSMHYLGSYKAIAVVRPDVVDLMQRYRLFLPD